MAKQTKQKKQTGIVGWLQRIFTLQTLAVVISLLSLYVGYRAWQDSASGEIEITFRGETLRPEQDEVAALLLVPSRQYYLAGYSEVVDTERIEHYKGVLPQFKNVSNRSVHNLKFTVVLNCPMKDLKLTPSEEYVHKSINDHSFTLEYARDVLPAHSSIPLPFNWAVAASDEDPPTSHFAIAYDLTYDGLDKPISFIEVVTVFCKHDADLTPSERTSLHNEFLTPLRDIWKDKEAKQCFLMVGDTTISRVSDLDMLDGNQYTLTSLSELQQPKRRLDWFYVFVIPILLIGACVCCCVSWMRRKKRDGDFYYYLVIGLILFGEVIFFFARFGWNIFYQ